MYRPPCSPNHRITTATFFDEFAPYMDTVILSTEPLLIIGDFNIKMDVTDDHDSIQFDHLLVYRKIKAIDVQSL